MSEIKGLQSVFDSFNEFEKEIQSIIKELVNDFTKIIELQAKKLVPSAGQPLQTSTGRKETLNVNLANFIFSEITNNGLTGIIGIDNSASELAIYIEFGTGTSAANYVPTLPTEFQEVAKQYYINGRGTLIKSPFLIPSFFQYSEEFKKELYTELTNKGYKISGFSK